ncbi:hypothetical protein [Streptomyces chartreusis]|jgi:hypothetical protein|uniref:hypothetical protein n=1 Tax=Streptomyces chartreusis TaxID=1969 RepID=UPI002E197445
MSKGSRGLCAYYIATALWLAWTTVNGWGHEHPSISILNAAASIVVVIAVVRETVIRDERRTVGRLVEKATRRTSWEGEPLPADGDPLDEQEAAVFEEIAGHWDDRSAA